MTIFHNQRQSIPTKPQEERNKRVIKEKTIRSISLIRSLRPKYLFYLIVFSFLNFCVYTCIYSTLSLIVKGPRPTQTTLKYKLYQILYEFLQYQSFYPCSSIVLFFFIAFFTFCALFSCHFSSASLNSCNLIPRNYFPLFNFCTLTF